MRLELEALRDECGMLLGLLCQHDASGGDLGMSSGMIAGALGRMLIRINEARHLVRASAFDQQPGINDLASAPFEAIIAWAELELSRNGRRRKAANEATPDQLRVALEHSVLVNDLRQKLEMARDALSAINVRATAALGESVEPSAQSLRGRQRVRRPESNQGRTPKPADFSIRGATRLGGLRAGAVRMLEEMSAFRPLGLTRHQVGFLAKVKSTSGTFSTYWGELRTFGYLEERPGDRWTCTEKAARLVCGPAPELTTQKGRADHFRARLRAGARRMLEEVERCPVHGMNREALGARAQVQSTSGTFSTYLGELVNNDLVVTERGGAVRLHPWLVEGREA